MSTTQNFNPPPAPGSTCYNPRMTRAAALALRTAGGLVENCVVVITDGPVIGTTGNTSATEIELNPVSPTELGETARVHTAFGISAWAGVYSIDLGFLTRLEDDRGNIVDDPTGTNIQTDFPWHNSLVQRNRVNGHVTLTAWGSISAAFSVQDNDISDAATIDLTSAAAVTSGSFIRNVFRGATFNGSGTPAAINVIGNEVYDSAVINSSQVAPATLNFSSNQLQGGTFNFTSTAGLAFLSSNQIQGGVFNLGGGSAINMSLNRAANATITRNAAHTGAFTWSNNTATSGVWTIAAGAAGASFVYQGNVSEGSTFNQNSAGAINVNLCVLHTIILAQNGTRGITLAGTNSRGATTITQNRTGGTGIDTITDCALQRATITLAGAIDPGLAQVVVNGATIEFATVNITNPAAVAIILQSSQVAGQATLNVQAGGALQDRIRLFGSTFNTGAFAHQTVVIEGGFVKTATISNNNRLCNKAYDDVA